MKCPDCERNDLKNSYALSNHMRRFHPGHYKKLLQEKHALPATPAAKSEVVVSAPTVQTTPSEPVSAPKASQPVATAQPPVMQAPGEIIPPITCPECGKTPFKNKAGLAAHRNMIHGIHGTAPGSLAWQKAKEKKGFPCPVCNRQFSLISGRNRHLNLTHHVKVAEDGSLIETSVTALAPKPVHQEEKNHGYGSSRSLASQDYVDPRITAEFVAYTVGKIEGLVERVASENDLPNKQFARRCAEYFQLSANR